MDILPLIHTHLKTSIRGILYTKKEVAVLCPFSFVFTPKAGGSEMCHICRGFFQDEVECVRCGKSFCPEHARQIGRSSYAPVCPAHTETGTQKQTTAVRLIKKENETIGREEQEFIEYMERQML